MNSIVQGIIVVAAESLIVDGGRVLGRSVGRWIGDPGRELIIAERRQGRVCVTAALISYYVPALIFVVLHTQLITGKPYLVWHAQWAAVEPYLRAHLFDGFGCAALYALIFRHFRQVHPVTGNDTRGARLRAASQLIFASTAIAASSVYIAGAGIIIATFAGLLAGFALLSFWYGVVSGFKPDVVRALFRRTKLAECSKV
jgi:hypothetical protein